MNDPCIPILTNMIIKEGINPDHSWDIFYFRQSKLWTNELEKELIALHVAGNPPKDLSSFGSQRKLTSDTNLVYHYKSAYNTSVEYFGTLAEIFEIHKRVKDKSKSLFRINGFKVKEDCQKVFDDIKCLGYASINLES